MKLNPHDQVLLEQAYIEMYKDTPCQCESGEKCTKEDCTCEKCKESKQELHEDAQDQAQDAALEKAIKELLLGAIRREELNEYSLERGNIVPEIMMAVQGHVKDQLQAAESKGYDHGLQAARDMDEFYSKELGD
jgi:hypothetical protein